MIANVGTVDRVLRLAVGVALISVALFGGGGMFGAGMLGMGAWKIGALAIGVVMIATGALRVCPLYALLGIRTCRS